MTLHMEYKVPQMKIMQKHENACCMKLSNGGQSMVQSSKHPNISFSTSREITHTGLHHLSQWEKSQSNHRMRHDIWVSSSIKNSSTNCMSNTSPKRALNSLSQSLAWQKAHGAHTID